VEATGDSWKPVCYLLEDEVEVQLLNAAHLHNVPDRKTDVTDSACMARLVEPTWPGRASCPRRQSGGYAI
jgi:transposase